MATSRIPVPMSDISLQKYRWQTAIAIPVTKKVSGLSKPIKIHIGSTKNNHHFANAVSSQAAISQETWGYGLSKNSITYPGPTLEAIAGQSSDIVWINQHQYLGSSGMVHHPFQTPPRELSTSMPMGRYQVGHTVVHLHGAHVPWVSDGYPIRVSAGMGNPTNATTVQRPGQVRPTLYPNIQAGGAMLWYHDHTMDMTASNVYAGMAGVYLLRHPLEKNMMKQAFRPVGLVGKFDYEIPLIIQDKSFTDNGELLYADAAFLSTYLKKDASGTRVNRNAGVAPMGEFKGQTLCVNGVVWPFLNLERRPYRFRILNGSNSRIYVLRLSGANAAGKPDTAGPAAAPMYQIGGDGGLYSSPVTLNGSIKTTQSAAAEDVLILAPGERADIVIDFSTLPQGKFFLTNHATDGTFGSGEFDGYGNGGDLAITDMTDAVLQFRVQAPLYVDSAFFGRLNNALTALTTTASFNPVKATPAVFAAMSAVPVSRSYTISEGSVQYSTPPEICTLLGWKPISFEQGLPPVSAAKIWGGIPPPVGAPPSGRASEDDIDLLSSALRHKLGSTVELWEFVNNTVDVHPIHLHHSMFYVWQRQKLDPITRLPVGAIMQADPNEQSGWKDTVRVNPDQVTRILVRFDDLGDTANNYKGHYVWHCHLLEHEDMGMMRPLEVF
jgi:spore coat protein A, manganese oxidase